MVYKYKQQESIDHNKTLAEVLKLALFWSLLRIAEKRGVYMEQMDGVTSFLYGFLGEFVFVNKPEGYVIDVSLVGHFRKVFYCLKQAPRL